MKKTFFTTILTSLSSTHESYFDSYSSSDDLSLPFPDADYDLLYRSNRKFKDTKKAEFGAIKNAQENIISATRSVDSLFLRLPSEYELNELILSADSVAILKTIQIVATHDSIPCEKRIAYLLELIGKLKRAIENKTFSADQIKVIIDGAQKEIKRLQKQIQRLKGEKKALSLDDLRDSLSKFIKDLEETYILFNKTQGKIPPKEGRIAGFEKDISILKKSSHQERNRIAQEKLQLTEAQALLRQLQIQFRNAQQRKVSLEKNIKESETIIVSNDQMISQGRSKIRRIEKQVGEFQILADQFRSKYTGLQIKVERLRTDISAAEAKEDIINAEINHNVDRINFQKKKIVQDQLDDLKRMILKLEELLPTTEKQIDRHYYYCYGEGKVQIQKTGNVTVYVVRGQLLGRYLHSAYGVSVKVPSLKKDVSFYKIDVFGPEWTNKFGYPFLNSPLKGKGLQFQDDFPCLQPEKLQKSYGTVDYVQSKVIYVNGNDGKVKLNVGACSRIQSSTYLPQKGQTIYYSAVPSSTDGYDLYAASCL